jgi:hypothetical protein
MAKKPDLTVVKDDTNSIKPPRKLGKHGMILWNAIQHEYAITDRGGVEVLAQICAMADRAEALADCIARDGETIRTKTGLRAHPALREELGARAFICRALEKLGVTVEPVKPIGRPPFSVGWTA